MAGQKDIVAVIPYKPRKGQEKLHKALERFRFGVVVAHRRFGKTVATINHLIKMAATCILERPRYGYIGPYYSQVKAIAWDYLKHFTSTIPGVKRSESELWVELPNGARIRLFGADNPDSLRGLYFDGVVLDEVAYMKPDTWEEVILPALSDRKGFAVFIGTPKGVNLLHKLYDRAIRDDKWYAGLFKASETGVIPKRELEQVRNAMSETKYRQEFECDFTASATDAFIPLDIVEKAVGKHIDPSAYAFAPLVIGVDVARFGDDLSVIAMRKGLAAFKLIKLKHKDTMQLAGRVAQLWNERRPEAVFVDDTGVGAGVTDRLRQLGYDPVAVQAGAESGQRSDLYANKRTEMWMRMEKWLREGGCIPDDPVLIKDLTAPVYEYDPQNRIRLEKKENMKKRGIPSPDCADALALTFAEPVFPRELLEPAASPRG